jgi:hypothetical protein
MHGVIPHARSHSACTWSFRMHACARSFCGARIDAHALARPKNENSAHTGENLARALSGAAEFTQARIPPGPDRARSLLARLRSRPTTTPSPTMHPELRRTDSRSRGIKVFCARTKICAWIVYSRIGPRRISLAPVWIFRSGEDGRHERRWLYLQLSRDDVLQTICAPCSSWSVP